MSRANNKREYVLSALRKDPELNAVQLSERFGVSASHVARWAREEGLNCANGRESLDFTCIASRRRKAGKR